MTAIAAPRPSAPPAGAPAPPERGETALRLVACVLLLVLWLAMLPPSGAYFARDWYPAALGSVLIFGVTVLARRTAVPRPRGARVALGIFAGLVAWAFLSIGWAGSPGDAWEAANKLVLPLAVAWTVALVPWTRETVALLLGAWSLGVAVFCATRLGTWLGAESLARWLDPSSQRINDPLGYPNASAALPAMALVPAIALSSIRALPAVVRALALPVAVFLAEFAVLPQSRGALVGAAAAIAVLVAVSGDRVRLVVRLLVIAALVAPAVGPLLDVGDAAIDDRPAEGLLDDAARTMAITVALAAVAGAVLAALDRLYHVPRRVERAFALAGIAVVVAGGAGVLVLERDRVADVVDSAWTPGQGPEGESRLLSVASHERPDYARVAADLFVEQPLRGVGAGNFGREYDARRRFEKHSRYAHNLGLRAISELGAVGALLLLALIGALGAGALATWRRLPRAERTLIAACLATGTYFLVHACFDWVEEFPALAAPAAGLGFAAVALAARSIPPRRARVRVPAPAPSPWSQRLVLAGSGLLALAVVMSLVPPYVAVRYTDRARERWTAAPAAAFADLERAADADPLSIDALVLEGALAQQLDQPARARSAFVRVLERERHWYAFVQLALLDAQAGRFSDADRNLASAAALSAEDPLVSAVKRRVERRERVDPDAVNSRARDSALFRQPGLP
jgi:O-Antigen ligase